MSEWCIIGIPARFYRYIMTKKADAPEIGDEVSYQSFGENFIRYLVTVPRLQKEIEGFLDATIEGSTEALPNDLLVGSYQFKPNDLHILRREASESEHGFALAITGVLTLTLTVMGMPVKAPMDVKIKLQVDVRTFYPLTIKLEPRKVRARDVAVNLQMPRELRRLPSRLIDRFNPMILAIRDNIARQVNRQLDRQELRESATIDILALANNALGESGDPDTLHG